jgi:hypothetical protein
MNISLQYGKVCTLDEFVCRFTLWKKITIEGVRTLIKMDPKRFTLLHKQENTDWFYISVEKLTLACNLIPGTLKYKDDKTRLLNLNLILHGCDLINFTTDKVLKDYEYGHYIGDRYSVRVHMDNTITFWFYPYIGEDKYVTRTAIGKDLEIIHIVDLPITSV